MHTFTQYIIQKTDILFRYPNTNHEIAFLIYGICILKNNCQAYILQRWDPLFNQSYTNSIITHCRTPVFRCSLQSIIYKLNHHSLTYYRVKILSSIFHEERRGYDRMVVWFTIHVHSVPITTKVVSSNPVHGDVYSIEHYVIKFVSFLPVLGFLHKWNWLPRYSWNIVERGVKHNTPNHHIETDSEYSDCKQRLIRIHYLLGSHAEAVVNWDHANAFFNGDITNVLWKFYACYN